MHLRGALSPTMLSNALVSVVSNLTWRRGPSDASKSFRNGIDWRKVMFHFPGAAPVALHLWPGVTLQVLGADISVISWRHRCLCTCQVCARSSLSVRLPLCPPARVCACCVCVCVRSEFGIGPSKYLQMLILCEPRSQDDVTWTALCTCTGGRASAGRGVC